MKQPALWAALMAFGLMSACANGGGDGGSNEGGGAPPVTTAPTARTAAAATKAAFAAFAAGSSTQQKAGGSAGRSEPGIAIRALDILKNHITPPRLSSKVLQAPSTCSGGGTTETTTVFPDFPENTMVTTTVYHDCVLSTVDNIETYRNGSMTVTETFDALTLELINVSVEFAHFRDGQRNVAAPANPIRLSDDTIDGVLSASNVEPGKCGGRAVLTSADAIITATLSTYEDVQGDGTAEADEAVATESLGIHLIQEYDTTDCHETTMTVTANGPLSAVDHVDTTGHNDFSAILTDFKLTETPATHDGVSGTEVTMNGAISVTSDCETGTFTVATTTPVFEPDSSASGCPTEGEVLVSGGGATVSVIATATGGIQFDEGDDGSIEEEFADCNEADICSTA
jgi:hypothetical protein